MATGTPLQALRELLDAVPAGPDGIVVVEELGRLVDAARIRVVSSMDAPLAESLGFASPTAAVATLARVSEKTARARLLVSGATRVDRTLTGAEVPARLPVLAAALPVVGLDAAEAITRQLDAVQAHVEPDAWGAAESIMVNLASGMDPTGQQAVVPESVTSLASQFSHLVAMIDPDGARPREERARRRRSFRIGRPDLDGLHPASGRLMPEIANLLLGLMEAQRRHDAFADVVIAAARSKDSPALDGLPVSVIVTVTASDLFTENGKAGDPIGSMAGSAFPVSRETLERYIDNSGLRLVRFNQDGTPAGVSTPQRCFTNNLRLQIVARDGAKCSTPGCTSPHYALQVHHVTPWRDGGPTHVNNGILLCFWHHQMVDKGPWEYRMVNGLPEVRGPGIPEWTRTSTPARAAA
jgi:hypothetical protein